MPKYEVTLYGTKEVEVNYTAVVTVEADTEEDAGDKAADVKTTKTWEMDDDQPSHVREVLRMDSVCVNQVDKVR